MQYGHSFKDIPRQRCNGARVGEIERLGKIINQHICNESGIYAPTNKIMHELVGTDLAEYMGNILFVNVEDGNLVIDAEMNFSATPLKYALLKRYPHLEVDIEEC